MTHLLGEPGRAEECLGGRLEFDFGHHEPGVLAFENVDFEE
jgi:hypothetical protein